MNPGTYSLDARVVVQHRFRSEPFTGPFRMALLTTAPTPEGTHSVELSVPDYARPEVEFGPPAARVLNQARLNARRVSFGPIGYDARDAIWAAVYDSEDQMLAYGRAYTCAGAVGPGEIAFDAGRIRIRF